MFDRALRAVLGSTVLLLIASVVLVSLVCFVSDRAKREVILHPYRVRKHFEVWRLLTAGWAHVDFGHLFFNMLSLWFFADPCLKVLGTARFIILYGTAVVVAFIPTTLRFMKQPRYGSLGASGAVAAVMFSAILLQPGMTIFPAFLPIRIPALVYAIFYIAYSVWHSRSAQDGINHDAHFSGALYGSLLTWLFEPAKVEKTLRAFF